jgi:hypothetical protein
MPIIYNDPLRGRPREAARIPAPTSTVLTEQFGQSFEENPIAAGKRWYDLEHQKSFGKRIDAGSAREQLKAAGLESDLTVDDAGITQEALDTLMWRKRTEKRRQDIFSRAEGGFAQGAARLGVAAAATLADPISAGLNFVPVVGQARYAKWLGAAGSIAGRTGVRAAVGAAEGAAGAAIVEPLIYASRTAEQADYDAVDSLMNVAFGGLIGTGMHTTVGSLGEVFARVPRGTSPVTTVTPQRTRIEPTVDAAADLARAMKPEDFQATVRAAVGQAVEGRPIDVEAVVSRAELKQTELPSFKQWFGDSKVVDAAGQPMRVYRGERRDYTNAPTGPAYATGPDDRGRWYASDPDAANDYASQGGRGFGEGAKVIPSYMTLRNPLVIDATGKRYDQLPYKGEEHNTDALAELAVADGYDGVIVRNVSDGTARTTDVYYAASPSQIKSAIGNSGRFDARTSSLTDPIEAERAELDAYAEETIAADVRATDSTEDTVAAAKEEETLATQQLKELYDRLGREVKSAEYDEVIEAATNAERWARTAELATVCLVRGG